MDCSADELRVVCSTGSMGEDVTWVVMMGRDGMGKDIFGTPVREGVPNENIDPIVTEFVENPVSIFTFLEEYWSLDLTSDIFSSGILFWREICSSTLSVGVIGDGVTVTSF